MFLDKRKRGGKRGGLASTLRQMGGLGWHDCKASVCTASRGENVQVMRMARTFFFF